MKVIDQNGCIPNQMTSLNLPQHSSMHENERRKSTFWEKLVRNNNDGATMPLNGMTSLSEEKKTQGRNNYVFKNANAHTSQINAVKDSAVQNTSILKHPTNSKDVNKVVVDFDTYSTYKLSYIDTKLNFSSETNPYFGNSTSDYLENSQRLDGNVPDTILSFNGERLSTSSFSTVTVSPKGEEAPKPARLAAVYLSTYYEKVKVSILGEEKKTLIVRDYGNQLKIDTDSSGFTKISESFSKVIVNGKEV